MASRKSKPKSPKRKQSPSALSKFLEQLDLDDDDELDLGDEGDLSYVYSLYQKAILRKPAKKPKRKPKPKPVRRKPRPKPPTVPAPIRELVEIELTDESEVRGGDALEPRTSHRVPLIDGRELAPNVYYVESGSLTGYIEKRTEYNDDRVMVSGHMNRKLRNFTEAFDRVYKDKMAHTTPFEDVDDLPLGRFGILIRTSRAMETRAEALEVIYKLAAIVSELLPSEYAAHIIDENKNISIRVGLGIYNEATLWSDGYREMRHHEPLLEEIADTLSSLTARDPVWFPFWEWPKEWVRPT